MAAEPTVSLSPERLAGAHGNRLAGDLWIAEGARDAAPVLLLHGGGQTRRAWDRVARDLAGDGYAALTVDQRGHGDSEWAEDGAYSFWDYAADAVSLNRQMRERFGATPIIIGASLGGIAGMLAEGKAGPDFWSAMILVDITPAMDPEGVEKIQSFMGAAMADGFETIEEAADAVAQYLPNRPRPKSFDGLRKNLRQGPDGRLRWHWDPQFLSGPRGINTGRENAEAEMNAALRGMSSPLLLVRGASSELISPEHVAALQTIVPHLETVDVGGAGHMVAGDRNDIFSAAIRSFLTKRKANAAGGKT
ncbi:alpha/beta fold hydrolase [Tepidamorphus sp. 3E244]|uniref:alpha/beta fold hydrolase n=1 Tax=Tepidamorphus sp. 3E244 TaxID=3385498 RepID=UPI0038FC2509